MASETEASQSNPTDCEIVRFGPFDRSRLELTPAELRLPVSHINIHAQPAPVPDYPTDKYKQLLIWRLVCVYDDDCRVPYKCVSFEIRREWNLNDQCFDLTPKPNVHLFSETTPALNCNITTRSYWWRKDTTRTFYGWRPTFNDIINFLETPINRYEKLLVNADTLEGTYAWVKALIGLLEEKRFVDNYQIFKIPGQPGSSEGTGEEEKITAVADFEWYSQIWLQAVSNDLYWV